MERLANGVWWLEASRTSPFSANAFLVDDDGALTLIDAGLPWDAAYLRSGIEAAGFDVAHVDRVLLTHYDLDHVGGLSALAPSLDARVYAGRLTTQLLAGEWTPDWTSPKGAFHRALQRMFSLPSSLRVSALRDGDAVGGFTAYHTPGHNPDHTVYVNEPRDVALLGDLARTRAGTLHPPLWWDSYDLEVVRESAVNFAERSPPFSVAGTGHGEPIRADAYPTFRTFAKPDR